MSDDNELPTTVGGYFAQRRKLIDGRKVHLERVGMLPEHAKALEMPTPDEKPLLGDPGKAPMLDEPRKPGRNEYRAPKLPKLLGVNATLTEEDEG